MEHRERRQRRRSDRSPLSAWLNLSHELKSDIGLLSADLCLDLFGRSFLETEEALRYVGITPWVPSSRTLIQDAQWTVLPVRAQTKDAQSRSTLQFSSLSTALKSFTSIFQRKVAFGTRVSNDKHAVEIRIIDAEPLILDSIFISVDGEALNRHDEIQKKFGGGFHAQSNGVTSKDKGKGKLPVLNGESNGYARSTKEPSQEDRLVTAIRTALNSPLVVRQGAYLSLPLPAHPITHVSLPPAKITICEPLRHGLLAQRTKIIINRTLSSGKGRTLPPKLAADVSFHSTHRADDDEIFNEQFHSAAEDDQDGQNSRSDMETSSASSTKSGDTSNSSDDSASEAFPVSRLPNSPFTFGSSFTTTDSRTGGMSTPGSINSSFTATTARQAIRERGKDFRPRALLKRIPGEVLNPKPAGHEDEEARIYIDTKMLMKLGTFSGDWVKVRALSQENKDRWGPDAFVDALEPDNFRVAKVYGLPNLSPTSAPQYPKWDSAIKKSSIPTMTSSLNRPVPHVWLSPILLANLGYPSTVRLSPLTFAPHNEATRMKRQNKVPTASNPPLAKELTLLMVTTPVVTEQAVQAGLMASTKQFFQAKIRILRQGDLVPILFDVDASRLLTQGTNTTDLNAQTEELLTVSPKDSSRLHIAWFRVQGTVVADVDDSLVTADVWGDTVSIDPTSTRMAQAGNERCKIPSPESSCEFYLGTKSSPRKPIPESILEKAMGTIPPPYISPLRRRLRELVAATTSSRAIHLGIDPMFILLHSTQRNIGKATLAASAVTDLGCHVFVIDAYELLSENGPNGGDVKTEGIFQARVERALTCGPQYTAILIRHIGALTSTRMISALKSAVSSARVIIGTTTEIDQLPDTLRSLSTHELEVSAPDETERRGLLHNIILDRGISLAHDVDLSSLALKSAALVAGDLADIIDRASTARTNRLESLLTTNSAPDSNPIIRDILISTPSADALTAADFDTALTHARASFATSIGAPKIPSVQWSDVGGLAHVKDAVMETIHLPLSRPELFAAGLKKRSGILFYGPPGTGKTLLAKAIATEFSLNFFSIKGPELLNMYIGESEANVRRVFQKARDARPCVVFFDELDSVAPKRGNQGDSGGVMDRIVSQLLAELDGMSDSSTDDGDGGKSGVFVIGATNRPDLLDAALLRPGRFDKMLYLGIPDTHEKQLTILQALTRKFNLAPELQLTHIAETLPFTYTGADLYALASDAMLKAITRRADAVDAKIRNLPGGKKVSTAYFFDHIATEEDISVVVTEQDFEVARRGLVGSVSVKELEHYKRVGEAFEGPERVGQGGVGRPGLASMPTTIRD